MSNKGLNWLSCLLIQNLATEIDSGTKFTVEEVREHIEKRDVISWIEKELPEVDLSGFKTHPERIELFHKRLEGYYSTKGHKTRGIVNNGLCYLISVITELIDNLDEDEN